MNSSAEDEHHRGREANENAIEGGTAKVKPRADVVKAVVERYYTRGVDAADRTRERSERGYTIASAIAAALVAAGLLTHLEERPTVVQILGLVGLGLWLLAALLFMWAVAVPVALPEEAGYKDEASFVQGIGDRLRKEIRVLNRRLMFALAATVIAIMVTVASLSYATADPGGNAPVRSRVALTRAGDAAVGKLCGRPIGDIYATVNPDALSHAIVPLEIPAGECGSKATIERVPKDEIAATEDVIEFPIFPQ